MMKVLWVLAVVYFVLLSSESALSSMGQNPNPGLRQTRYLVDAGGHLSIDDILQKGPEDWKKFPASGPNFGFRKETFWFKLAIPACGEESKENVIEIAYPLLDHIDLWLLGPATAPLHYETGDVHPFSHRALPHLNFGFPYDCSTYNQAIFRIATTSSMQVPLKIWEKQEFIRDDVTTLTPQLLYFGAISVMALYNAFIFISIRKSPYLYYTLFAASFATFQAGLSGIGFRFVWPEYPELNNYVIDKSINFVSIFALQFAAVFLNIRTQAPRLWRLRGFMIGGIVVVSIFTISMPYGILIKLSIGMITPSVALAFVMTGISIRNGQREGYFFGTAWTAFLIGALVLALNKLGALPRNVLTENIQQLASVAEMLFLSFALADQMNALRKKLLISNSKLESSLSSIEFFNKNLEKIVESKTKEIRSLLDNVPQGICRIDHDGRVMADFSAHLIEILEHKDIVDRPVADLIFQHADLSFDARNQALQALYNSLTGTSLDFYVNVTKLPTEFLYRYAGKEKFLKATWSVMADANDDVLQIMLTLMDITVEKNLEIEASHQKTIFRRISELVTLKPQNVARFFESTALLIREGFRLIRQDELSEQASRKLFHHAHTIKGEARTLQLQGLTNVIHEAEDMLVTIEKGGFVSPSVLETVWLKVQQEFDLYVDINRNMLNRGEEGSRIIVDKQLALQHYRNIRQLLSTDNLSRETIIQHLQALLGDLENQLFETIASIFAGYAERAGRIAMDLGKPKPSIDLQLPHTMVSPETHALLDQCMIHILRNALDHGIEAPEERISKGKAEAGSILIRGVLANGKLDLDIEDDGRGLNVTRLRKQGLEKGLINAESSLQEITELIFSSGLSTAQVVTDISGRGVGMDAVRGFLEEVGGAVQIHMKGGLDSQGFVAFRLNLLVPMHLESMQKVS